MILTSYHINLAWYNAKMQHNFGATLFSSLIYVVDNPSNACKISVLIWRELIVPLDGDTSHYEPLYAYLSGFKERKK